jgi:hypothetical protein
VKQLYRQVLAVSLQNAAGALGMGKIGRERSRRGGGDARRRRRPSQRCRLAALAERCTAPGDATKPRRCFATRWRRMRIVSRNQPV